jgi:hypothetical protein
MQTYCPDEEPMTTPPATAVGSGPATTPPAVAGPSSPGRSGSPSVAAAAASATAVPRTRLGSGAKRDLTAARPIAESESGEDAAVAAGGEREAKGSDGALGKPRDEGKGT